MPIPLEECRRTATGVTWSTEQLLPLLNEAAMRKMAVLKIHSHPGGFAAFSDVDDRSDQDLFASVFGWVDTDDPHASAVMLPNGEIFGRAILSSGVTFPLASIAVAGDDVRFWHSEPGGDVLPAFTRRHAQAFGAGTTALLRRLSIAVVGCSGTGSIVVELLARLGVGHLVLVDPERIEEKNLNRILNATIEDARAERSKVEVLRDAVAGMGLDTRVTAIGENLATPLAVRTVAGCDVVFGCMDGVEGRHLLNRIAAFYAVPYFDMGVRLEADGCGSVDQVCGAVHYVQPDRSSLLSRGVVSLERLQAEEMRRINPSEYKERVRVGYLRGVLEDRPAVISVNALTASLAVSEFRARLHPHRLDPNSDFATVWVSLTQGSMHREGEAEECQVLARHVGRGDVEPLLDRPELSEPSSAAV